MSVRKEIELKNLKKAPLNNATLVAHWPTLINLSAVHLYNSMCRHIPEDILWNASVVFYTAHVHS